MSTLGLRIDTEKHHGSRWTSFLGHKPRETAPPQSTTLLLGPAPASLPRTPSPALSSDTSQPINVDVSPLPSPLLGPRLDVETLATTGSKTNAFFSSPWKSLVATPVPPPPITLVPSPSTDPTPSNGLSTSDPVNIPKPAPQLATRNSQTVDFFSSAAKHIPSPPLSVRHLSPPDEKPDSAPALRLHLARLAQTRAVPDQSSTRSFDEVDTGSRSRSSSYSSTNGFIKPAPRDFAYWTPESSNLSRSSSRSSVSGVRRDLGFTLYDVPASSSYSPSTHPSSPLGRIRQIDETPMPMSPMEMLTPRPVDSDPVAPTAIHNPHALVRRETQRNPSEKELQVGMTIGDDAPLVLVRLLGHGAFSSVWLARDIEDRLIPPGPRQRRRKSVSTARRKGDALPGLRPAPHATTRLGVLNELDGEGASLPSPLAENEPRGRELGPPSKVGKLVAVKTLDRKLCDVNDRTRIAFVREVEVLRHISHPSIVAFLHSFTIETHHCLVLEHVSGGELFELINSDENYAKMTTPLIRRMWGELCRAVGWLHGVAVVHRDIKLENIILTVNPFRHTEAIDVALLPQPLVKLTDFGLARFIDLNQPMLTTRCGSESYAAPEIVMGSSYDGRQTDAWACGIVLYALAVRTLPFDPKGTDNGQGSRRRYLVRIAKAEYSFPDDATLATDDLKAMVARLLVRDPIKRAKISEIWEDDFMRGKGAPSPPWRVAARRRVEVGVTEIIGGDKEPTEEHEDEYEEGVLVDGHDIDEIASQELH
ncbi:SubName: Full=Related to SNF1-related protein kinase KIN10 {ECO:0000313/EMBL:CCA66888.1} [Serendipita indica DSM 11827]|uniref:Related to SNF1-related protein kinase KIN10 n=1 Tax=Serendipita indica (strain DSM 11827) TaxID=1109443 RepID=G4T6H3_SERID|nr:SubName: Full=Related to SNF1-related protein kinase KIN10 {ECO:0000313/EMBL:CCA66888.1} [Serendipita indica DSM 11827]CCA66888.1 related to SNF1-related protein kinase KIN10 [Serendipita indica DSM 11827]